MDTLKLWATWVVQGSGFALGWIITNAIVTLVASLVHSAP